MDTTSAIGKGLAAASVSPRARWTSRVWPLRVRPSPCGFTLMELMVVLAILVLVAAAFPLAIDRTLPSRRVNVGAERIRAQIRTLEDRSIATGEPVRTRASEFTKLLASATHVSVVDLEGAPLDALVLLPDGSSSGARVLIADGRYHSFVRVSALTGRVVVASEEGR